MKNVMVDNWFMEDAISKLQDSNRIYTESYGELLMAIILWDQVYYPENKYNWWKNYSDQIKNILNPIDDMYEEGLAKSMSDLYYFDKHSKDEYDWANWKGIIPTESDIIGSGALRYIALSSKNDCDYLPCSRRREFLREYSGRQDIKSSIIRLKRFATQYQLDRIIEEYYEETYKALEDFSNLELKMPVLVNYIFDNARGDMTPIDYAFHLKHEGPVIRYRQYLDQLIDALELQNWKELRFLLGCSNDAIADVISLDKKMFINAGASIFPLPSVYIQVTSAAVEIKEFFNRPFRKMHLTFLKDLTQYGIDELKRW